MKNERVEQLKTSATEAVLEYITASRDVEYGHIDTQNPEGLSDAYLRECLAASEDRMNASLAVLPLEDMKDVLSTTQDRNLDGSSFAVASMESVSKWHGADSLKALAFQHLEEGHALTAFPDLRTQYSHLDSIRRGLANAPEAVYEKFIENAKSRLTKAIERNELNTALMMKSDANITIEDITKEIRKERQNGVSEIEQRAQAAALAPGAAVIRAGQLLSEYEREYPDFKDLKRKEILFNAEENTHFKTEFQAKAPDVLKLAQQEKEVDPLRNGSDIKRFSDLYPNIAQEQGIPLKSMPGKYAVFNSEPGQTGAEIIDRQGRRECLGNAETIDRFAAQNKLSADDLKALKAMDARAVPHRSTLTAAASPVMSPYFEGKKIPNLSQAKLAVASPTKAIGMKL